VIVRESLNRFELLNEEFLAENILNEKFDINLLTSKAQKIAVLASMFFMFVGGTRPEIVNSLPDKAEISKDPLIYKMAQEDSLSRDQIFMGFQDLLDKYKPKKEQKSEILSAGTPGFIESINSIKPGRLDSSKIAHYDQYDADIMKAVNKLRAKGENPDPNLIKTIMIIETGMNPRKNSLGYEGFPQTKQHIINGINEKNRTGFTMMDMYVPEKAAEFIHYYLKTVQKSQWVDDIDDLIIAYNWGLGNLRDYKKGEREMPQQTADYIAMINSVKDNFGT
jgi:hypothetical protein